MIIPAVLIKRPYEDLDMLSQAIVYFEENQKRKSLINRFWVSLHI